ncbi:MAG TPA: hypothetical protein VHY91_03645 [Pirellulales bacterium]|jgi:hypothetical protein|nr:hypothetical protein [Pirellulales bacterium]
MGGLAKFCLVSLAAASLQFYFVGNGWVLAAGVAACYVGWLVDAAGKEVDKKLQELHRKRLVPVTNTLRVGRRAS